ncbi:abscisic stress-ripening protein 2-like [Henckelia pumila]|uniref:abscisic stress-ripening protein 2-like n=1 Tax=Henckelia pumila TaxID=405737 RepID=UPI003C6E6B28
MAEEKQHHHLFQHHKEEEKPVEAVIYSETAYGVDGAGQRYETTETAGYVATHDYEKERKSHQRKEHLGELGTAAAGAYALYEKHQAKKDPENKHRHKIQEEIATAVAVGAGGYTFHEHHEKKEVKHEQEKTEGKHHHHHF